MPGGTTENHWGTIEAHLLGFLQLSGRFANRTANREPNRTNRKPPWNRADRKPNRTGTDMIYIKPEPGEQGRRTATRTGELPFFPLKGLHARPILATASTAHCVQLICFFDLLKKSESLSLFYIPTYKHGRHLVKKISLCSSTLGPSARDRTRAGYKDMRQENILQPTQFSLQLICFFDLLKNSESLSLFYIPTYKHGRHLVKKISLCSNTLGPSARPNKSRVQGHATRAYPASNPILLAYSIWQLEATPEKCFCFFQPLEKAKYMPIT